MKILNVVGARPNLVKIAPLLREMGKQPKIHPLLVHTGQHYDERLSGIFFRQLGIREPDVNLGVGSGSHIWQIAEILKCLEPILLEHKPDLVLVVGDVNSTIAGSLAAVKLDIPVAHVEAGLRSFDRKMPEETNRVLTDAIATYLFATEQDAVENLLREGRSRDCIHLVGNVMIDALQSFLPLAEESKLCEELGLARDGKVRPFAVLTLHRPSNVDSPEALKSLLDVMEELSERLPIIFPVHPRTRTVIQKLGKDTRSRLQLVPPVGYVDFLGLLSRAKLVLTDSGGIQEETTALGVPCLTLRENTERPVTVLQGTNEIVGVDPIKIRQAVECVLAGRWKDGRLPPLWDGHSAERIVEILRKQFPSGWAST